MKNIQKKNKHYIETKKKRWPKDTYSINTPSTNQDSRDLYINYPDKTTLDNL